MYKQQAFKRMQNVDGGDLGTSVVHADHKIEQPDAAYHAHYLRDCGSFAFPVLVIQSLARGVDRRQLYWVHIWKQAPLSSDVGWQGFLCSRLFVLAPGSAV